jgi:hypothetical protein
MPSAEEILDGLSATANAWQPLAVVWHVYFAGLIGGVALGWRPSRRLLGALLVPPLVAVGGLALEGGNPFNGAVFGLLSVALAGLSWHLEAQRASPADSIRLGVGTSLLVFAWIYPHFLEQSSWLVYAYAAPLGLVPCPTLCAAIGVTIAFRGLGSRAWSLTLVAAGLFYGLFGSLRLGVTIDWALTAGAACLLAYTVREWIPSRPTSSR